MNAPVMDTKPKKSRPTEATRRVSTAIRGGGAVDVAAHKATLSEVAADDAHIYRVIELVGSSEKSIEDAIAVAIERANQTIRNLRWFEVARTSGDIDNGKVRHYQVTLKVGFTMEHAR